jgi:hypothetical protein
MIDEFIFLIKNFTIKTNTNRLSFSIVTNIVLVMINLFMILSLNLTELMQIRGENGTVTQYSSFGWIFLFSIY